MMEGIPDTALRIRRRLEDYGWQQSLVDYTWVLQINNTYSFEVAFHGYGESDEDGQEEIYSYTVVDSIGRRGKVLFDCCCNCAKWKCIGYLDRNKWRQLAPSKGEEVTVQQLHLKALFYNAAWADTIINRAEMCSIGGVGTITRVPTSQEAITDCFLWDETPEGVRFWHAVAIFVGTYGAEALCKAYPTLEIAFDHYTKTEIGRL